MTTKTKNITYRSRVVQSCEWNQVQSQDLNEHHLSVITYHLSPIFITIQTFISNNQTFVILLLQNW